ncbi:MAG: hypothetical protein EOS73_09685 [Mesorhizobium sp.]|uniref:hypothetical protein n=1 Tax=Mesorhizobium sp. M7A.F.Ca.ET.027.02.1.1 TaxID=2496655 RepID=UPI000FD3875C|nr:hypothetical protein [Mesorhizobium sp. M7A.F.Ca.ET.027.02.1.1]RVD17816.1 hypothetical protein EN749_07320 [Mesorhizobium sp. M7A.F.Ca.ET.027.02.1.1]RWD09808.1 MAG: hypothetical protein EOS73_09685 [Mesorhizobium sp.]
MSKSTQDQIRKKIRRARTPGNRQKSFLALREITDEKTRNLMRGILAQNATIEASSSSINSIRKNCHAEDLANAVTMLLGRNGAFPFPNINGKYRDLLLSHKLDPITPEAELIFILGHVNGWKELSAEILGAISTLRDLASADPVDALGAIRIFAERWGASNYLAKKVAFVMATSNDRDLSQSLGEIADIVEQEKAPNPYFSALESIDSSFSYFGGISTRVQVYGKYVTDDFRQFLALHNIVGSPVSHDDIGPFIRKSHSMSLVDEVVAILQLLHTGERWPWIRDTINRHLDPDLKKCFIDFCDIPFHAEALFAGSSPLDADLTYYRRSLAFLEFRAPALYRGYVDQVVGHRLLGKLLRVDTSFKSRVKSPSRRELTKALHGFHLADDYKKVQKAGRFLRTISFLVYLENLDGPLRLNHHDIRFILDNTTALDTLMSEIEMERLYLSVDEQSRPLVTVLALALHKARSHSDDVDFKFRLNLSIAIESKFQSSIVVFIEWLLNVTPEVANFLLSVLDRSTLQKMYWIVRSADEADQIRQDILRAVGRKKELIEYFVEADSIEAQRQVSRLRKYFDDSRIFVDGVAMKRWLVENPSSYSQQYIRMIERNVETITAHTISLSKDGLTRIATTEIASSAAYDYILFEVAQIAFQKFCTDVNFGIESYLGRRIRHNTLSGVMRSGVDSIIDKFQFRALQFEKDFMDANARWTAEYRSLIDIVRNDYLQFRSTLKPKGLFSAELKADTEPTRTNIALLRGATWAARSGELLNDLLIRFCWREIDPQLNAAAKFITSNLLQRANTLIESNFQGFQGDLYKQYRAELHDAVHERFIRLASWFRQPESGFVTASTKQLGDLIFMEASEESTTAAIEWKGGDPDALIDGLSVHRMYDCLSVLIRNALGYSREWTPIEVSVDKQMGNKANIARLNVSVTSTLASPEERQAHIERLAACFADEDLSASMVREGYSGIKKLRFILMHSEGSSTASYSINHDLCRISFVLTVELASDEELKFDEVSAEASP